MTGGASAKHDDILVLIVDDDDSVLWTLKELLKVHGFKVEAASCGADALDLLDRVDPDCILMDMSMAGQSGIEVFRKIKPLKPSIPVIFMTGHALEDLEDAARREGAAAVIAKPIDMKHLVSLIESIAAQSCPGLG